MPEPIIAKQRVRTGNLVDLPILSIGEQGYATDSRRMFIGNPAITLAGDGEQQAFNFGVDLEGTYRYEVYVDGATVNNYTITDDGETVNFTTPPGPGTDVTLKYNTEILTYEPDRNTDVARKVTLPPVSQVTPIAEVNIDMYTSDNIELKYSLRGTDGIRNGVITITAARGGLDNDELSGRGFIISDRYDVHNNTPDGSTLDHVFGCNVVQKVISVEDGQDPIYADMLELNYTTTATNNAQFSFKEDSWFSRAISFLVTVSGY